MRCYDMKGNAYPCQMFMPSTSEGGKNRFCKDTISIEDITFEGECKECTIISLCSTCIGSSYIEYGRLCKTPGDVCDYRKIELLGYCTMMFEMLKDKERYILTRDLTDVEVALIFIAIEHIQEKVLESSAAKYLQDEI